MSRELPLSSTGQQWVVNAYVLAMASLVALGGKLGDRFGGVTTFRFGVVIFFLASMACDLAPHGPLGEPWLIAARVLQDLLRPSPIQAGLGVLPLILPIAAAAQLGGRWYDKAGVRPPVLTGLAIAVLGLAGWAVALPQLGYLLQVPGMIATGFGIGLVISPTNTDALGRVDAAECSQASGLVQTVRQLGGTFGVAVIGAVVLGIESAGTAAGSAQNAADAITVGFAVAAAVFALALLVGWRLLSATRLTVADPARDSAGDVAVGS
jgi:MFS family permease